MIRDGTGSTGFSPRHGFGASSLMMVRWSISKSQRHLTHHCTSKTTKFAVNFLETFLVLLICLFRYLIFVNAPLLVDMPPAKRRRVAEASEAPADQATQQGTTHHKPTDVPSQEAPQLEDRPDGSTNNVASELVSGVVEKNKERQDRFKALQARAVSLDASHMRNEDEL